MNSAVFLAILASAAALGIARGYDLAAGAPVLAIAAVLLAIPWYLSTRDRSKPPSSAERVVASGWVWFRRIVCFGIGVLCFHFASAPWAFGLKGKPIWDAFLWTGGFLAVGVVVVALGVFGYGARYYGDNRGAGKLHSDNKKRYGWRL
jgi:hypothetical protein